MEVSQVGLAYFIAVAFITGLSLGLWYDMSALLPAVCGRVFHGKTKNRLEGIVLPIIRRNLKGNNKKSSRIVCTVFNNIHDFCFMLTFGGVIAVMIYVFNDGQYRVGAIGGVIFGMALYRITLRRLLLPVVEAFRYVIRVTVIYVFFFVSYPVKIIIKNVIRMVAWFREKHMERRIIAYGDKTCENLKKTAAGTGCLQIKFKKL